MSSFVNRLSRALLATAIILPSAAVWSSSDLPAVPQNQQEIIDRFKAADKNGDGKLTREEAEHSMPRVALAWDKIDIDKKGYITLEQLLIISAANQ